MSVMTPGGRNQSVASEPRLIIDLEDASKHFTKRQHEVLKLVARGAGNADIASELGLSRRTVEKHIERIHMKAGTGTRARLVAFASALDRLEQDEGPHKD